MWGVGGCSMSLDEIWLGAADVAEVTAFHCCSLVTLTLAIGANTAIFGLMNAVMLKALPVPDADRLVLLAQPQERSGYSFNYPLFQRIERQSEPVVDLFGFSRRNVQLHNNEGISIVQACWSPDTIFARSECNRR